MGILRAAMGGTNSPLKPFEDLQQAAISGRLLKLFLTLFKKGQLANFSGNIASIQQDSSATKKSAKVRVPNTRLFSPTVICIWSSLGPYFSRTPALAVWQSAFMNSYFTADAVSLKIEIKLQILALYRSYFPSNYVLPHLFTMYLGMADDSVMLQSPSTKQGRLGKLKPIFFLSCSPHSGPPRVQEQSSKSTPEQASRSLGTCPRPLTFQYPSLTLASLGCMAAIGGIKGSFMAFGLSQYAFISGRHSKLCLILDQKGQFPFSLGQSASKQQSCSDSQKSAQVKYPSANGLSPTNFLRLSSLGLILSRMGPLAVQQSLFMHSPISSFLVSVSTPMMLPTIPASSRFFPSSSHLPDFSTMQDTIADDSVSLKSPSIKQGRLGNSRPRLIFYDLNHFSRSSNAYCTSWKSTWAYARSSLIVCAAPRTFQQPRTIFPPMSKILLESNKMLTVIVSVFHQKLKFIVITPNLLKGPSPQCL